MSPQEGQTIQTNLPKVAKREATLSLVIDISRKSEPQNLENSLSLKSQDTHTHKHRTLWPLETLFMYQKVELRTQAHYISKETLSEGARTAASFPLCAGKNPFLSNPHFILPPVSETFLPSLPPVSPGLKTWTKGVPAHLNILYGL